MSGNNQHRGVGHEQALLASLPSLHDVKPPPFSLNPPVFMAGYLWPQDQQELRSPRCSHSQWLLRGFQPFFKPWPLHFENVTFGGYRCHLRWGAQSEQGLKGSHSQAARDRGVSSSVFLFSFPCPFLCPD